MSCQSSWTGCIAIRPPVPGFPRSQGVFRLNSRMHTRPYEADDSACPRAGRKTSLRVCATRGSCIRDHSAASGRAQRIARVFGALRTEQAAGESARSRRAVGRRRIRGPPARILERCISSVRSIRVGIESVDCSNGRMRSSAPLCSAGPSASVRRRSPCRPGESLNWRHRDDCRVPSPRSVDRERRSRISREVVLLPR